LQLLWNGLPGTQRSLSLTHSFLKKLYKQQKFPSLYKPFSFPDSNPYGKVLLPTAGKSNEKIQTKTNGV